MGRRERRTRKQERVPSLPRGTRRALWRRPVAAPLLLAALLLAASVEERLFGVISDEQQMLFTSVSMSGSGEIGIARGQLFSVHRPGGDAVSPYGMGLPLLEVPAASAAWAFERWFGPGSSQTLFVLLQICLILAAAAAAGKLASMLGASRSGTAIAVLGTVVGSPLWAYAGSGFSEPLQGAALAGAAVAGAAAVRAPSGRRALALAAAAGGGAGLAILAKSLNVALVPFALAPLLLDGDLSRPQRGRLAAVAAAGAVPPLAAWLAFEFVRFGGPFASYGGQNFTHPFLDGFWRLVVGPNKGLLLFFPLLALAVVGCARLAAHRASRGTAVAAAGVALAALCLTSAWWAWDGTVGWGPRFLVPAIPLLAAASGAAVGPASTVARRVGWALLAVGIAVNLPGVLTAPSAATAYLTGLPGRVLSEREIADFPRYYLENDRQGRPVLPRHFYAASQSHLNPVRIHLFLLGVRLGGGTPEERMARLEAPPWLASHPKDVPDLRTTTSASAAAPLTYLVSGFVWPHLGASLAKPAGEGGASFASAFLDGVGDQILRDVDIGETERAVSSSERLLAQAPSPYAVALHAESLRAAGRRDGFAAFLATLSPELRVSPSLGVVLALAARDAGEEKRAREVLEQVARGLRRPGVVAAVGAPLAAWPANLHGMTGENLATRALGRPRLGR